MSRQARRAIYRDVISQEAISYQANSMFLQDLTFAFQNLIAGGVYNQPAMDKLNLSKIVARHTGLNLEFKLAAGELNAFAIPPFIDVNSPLMDRFRIMGLDSAEGLGDYHLTFKKITSFTKELRGSIDRANGRVSGVFSKILTSVTIGSGLWEKGKLTPEEVAAVCLHEIGHVFTFLECLMQTATMNMVLASANQALAKTTEMEHRLQLVHETAQALDIKVENKESLARPNIKPDAFNAVFLKATMDPELRSAAGSATYDLRSSEFLADQFAARYGAGRALVTGLDKMHRATGGEHRRSLAVHIAVQVIYTWAIIANAIAMPIIATVVIILMLIFANPEAKVYDDPAERLLRIRNDLVQSLKDGGLPAKTREQILKDIEYVDKAREGVVDRRTYFSYLWMAMSSKRRDQFKQMRFQQEIEGLVNNEFFVKAQQFKHLA
jgi:hypothetical protein